MQYPSVPHSATLSPGTVQDAPCLPLVQVPPGGLGMVGQLSLQSVYPVPGQTIIIEYTWLVQVDDIQSHCSRTSEVGSSGHSVTWQTVKISKDNAVVTDRTCCIYTSGHTVSTTGQMVGTSIRTDIPLDPVDTKWDRADTR